MESPQMQRAGKRMGAIEIPIQANMFVWIPMENLLVTRKDHKVMDHRIYALKIPRLARLSVQAPVEGLQMVKQGCMGTAIKIQIQANMYAQVRKLWDTSSIWGIEADPATMSMYNPQSLTFIFGIFKAGIVFYKYLLELMARDYVALWKRSLQMPL